MRARDLAEREFRPLGLNSRTINALWRHDICTLRELSQLTERALAVIPGIGAKGLSQLSLYIRKPGPTQEIHDRRRTVAVKFEPDALTAIDSWAQENGPISGRAEAVRRLVEMGLTRKASRNG
jgi:hypothetical protein